MTDIVERLRGPRPDGSWTGALEDLIAAADEIEKLRGELAAFKAREDERQRRIRFEREARGW